MNGTVLTQSLSSLLQIENDKELIEITCSTTGLPIWPLIRVPVMRTIMSDWLYKSTPLSSTGSNVNFIKLARGAANSLIHNLSCETNNRTDVLIQSTGLGNYTSDGLVKDRLVGHFAGALPAQTLVYQDKPKESFQKQYSFNPVLHKTPRNIVNKLYSKLATRNRHIALAQRVVDHAVENALNRLNYKFSSDAALSLSNSLAGHLAVLPYATDAYANWFSRQGFKLLLKEDACYGGSAISIIHAARLSGMTIAEYQHGAISKGHGGYNVADALVTSESFKTVLPDYLLTYGDWWSNQTNMPVRKIAIGNPHLTETLSTLDSATHKKNQVLVLGDGIETELYLNLTSQILEVARGQGMAVVFRPHPFERDRVKLSTLPAGVQLDIHSDIYPSLKESNVVISELSTGLFEAVGLVDKVLLWETDKSRFAFPEVPFRSFSSLSELEASLNGGDSDGKECSTVSAEELWMPNWKQNYLGFVEGVVSR